MRMKVVMLVGVGGMGEVKNERGREEEEEEKQQTK